MPSRLIEARLARLRQYLCKDYFGPLKHVTEELFPSETSLRIKILKKNTYSNRRSFKRSNFDAASALQRHHEQSIEDLIQILEADTLEENYQKEFEYLKTLHAQKNKKKQDGTPLPSQLSPFDTEKQRNAKLKHLLKNVSFAALKEILETEDVLQSLAPVDFAVLYIVIKTYDEPLCFSDDNEKQAWMRFSEKLEKTLVPAALMPAKRVLLDLSLEWIHSVKQDWLNWEFIYRLLKKTEYNPELYLNRICLYYDPEVFSAFRNNPYVVANLTGESWVMFLHTIEQRLMMFGEEPKPQYRQIVNSLFCDEIIFKKIGLNTFAKPAFVASNDSLVKRLFHEDYLTELAPKTVLLLLKESPKQVGIVYQCIEAMLVIHHQLFATLQRGNSWAILTLSAIGRAKLPVSAEIDFKPYITSLLPLCDKFTKQGLDMYLKAKAEPKPFVGFVPGFGSSKNLSKLNPEILDVISRVNGMNLK